MRKGKNYRRCLGVVVANVLLVILGLDVSLASGYDSAAAVAYADQWWNARNSTDPYQCDPYQDYSDRGGDCANFVSQCLAAGGLDVSTHPYADVCGSIVNARYLHDYLVNYLGATWETRPKGQTEPLWFLPGDPAIFGYSDAHPLTHVVFAVTGDATHYATCNAHTSDQYHRSIQWFFNYSELYDTNPFDRCTYYHISAAVPPSVETRPAAPDAVPTTVILNAAVVDDGGASIDERRFDWGTTPDDAGWTDWVTDDPESGHYGLIDVSGNSFSYHLPGLEPGITYYFRAWAKNTAGWGYGSILSFTLPKVEDFEVTPDSVTLGGSFTISYTVSDTSHSGMDRVELWRAADIGGAPGDWEQIDSDYISGNGPLTGEFYDGPSSVGEYWYGVHLVNKAGFWSVEPDPPGAKQVTVIPGVTDPPICVIELLEKDRIDPIDEIPVGEWFDIYVGDSTDDIGIEEVRFSSDGIQDGIPQGTWTEWYDWEVSTGPYGWSAMNKCMAWTFAISGRKEVWAELKDSEGKTSRCYDNIYVPCVCTPWQDQGCGQGPCFETQMYQTRTCDSPGCAVEERCNTHPSCEPGWRSPTANGRYDSEWSTPENAYVSDNNYAVASGWFSIHDWYNFGFDIPGGSIIEGIEVGIEGTGDGIDNVGKVKVMVRWKDFHLDETDYLEFPATEEAFHKVGGPSDLWGWNSWTPENFKDGASCPFIVRISTGADWYYARIDSVQARVYYRVCPDVSYDWLGLSCLADSWLQQCSSANDYCNCCDMNNDRIIDFQDFVRFAQRWLESEN